jgi:hypothetical protein
VLKRPKSSLTPQRAQKANGTERAALPLGIGQAVFLIQRDRASGRNGLVSSNETASCSHPTTACSSRSDG